MSRKANKETLTWTEEPLDTCIEGGGPIDVKQVLLTLLGPEDVTYELELGYCRKSGRWYGLMDDLVDLVGEAGWEFGEVTGCAVNDRPVELQILLEGMDVPLPWQTFVEASARARAEMEAPPPSDEEVRALPVVPETWEMGTRAAVWVSEGDRGDMPRVGYLTIIVDGQGLVRMHHIEAGAMPDAPTMAGVVRRAAVSPIGGERKGRPRRVRVAGEARAHALNEALGPAGVQVVAAPTPAADEALAAASEHVLRSGAAPFLNGYDEATLRAYFRAARAFYRARPWRRLDGDRYLAFSIGDGPWHYAGVMGQAETEPGISLFESWNALCRFVHNRRPALDFLYDDLSGPLGAVGTLEGMTLCPVQVLHPEDGAYLLRLGIKPLRRGAYPLPQRFSEEGAEPIRFSLVTYRLLLEAIVSVLHERKAAQVTSITKTAEVDGVAVTLRYPADGLEAVRAAGRPLPGFRLVVEGGRTEDALRRVVPAGSRIVIDAPGDAKVYDMARALRRTLKHVWMDGLGAGEIMLWSEVNRRKEPSPYLASLEALDAPWVELMGERYPVRLLRRVGAVGKEIEVRREP